MDVPQRHHAQQQGVAVLKHEWDAPLSANAMARRIVSTHSPFILWMKMSKCQIMNKSSKDASHPI